MNPSELFYGGKWAVWTGTFGARGGTKMCRFVGNRADAEATAAFLEEFEGPFIQDRCGFGRSLEILEAK